MAIPDLNAPPEGEEELPDLNNKSAQEEDDGPLQDVVAAGEGGGPEALSCLFHQAADQDVEVHGGATSTGHHFGLNLHETDEEVFRQGKHTVCIQKIIVLVLFLSLLSPKICVLFSLSPKNSAIVLNLYLSSPKIIVYCFHFCPQILIAESSNRCIFFLIEVPWNILKCLCISPKTLV